jgi:hypothetical protein
MAELAALDEVATMLDAVRTLTTSPRLVAVRAKVAIFCEIGIVLFKAHD